MGRPCRVSYSKVHNGELKQRGKGRHVRAHRVVASRKGEEAALVRAALLGDFSSSLSSVHTQESEPWFMCCSAASHTWLPASLPKLDIISMIPPSSQTLTSKVRLLTCNTTPPPQPPSCTHE